MMMLESKSLAHYIQRLLTLTALLILVLLFLLLKSYQWQTWNIIIVMLVSSLGLLLLSHQYKQRILSSFDRAVLHTEAIKMEDYTQFAKSDFKQGNTAELHEQLKELSVHLQSQKSRYDQHAFLLYQLIDQLNTPIMVFNQKQKLTYANTAFASLYGQPWQMFRSSSPKVLGLSKNDNGWQYAKKDQQWQISQSEFIDTGETHLLLVFTNIDSAVRASQQNAWQQIIRVMGHEIRNSLTPVSSLAESLMHASNSEREVKALSVITERCQHLQDFINRYSSLSLVLNLQIKSIKTTDLVARLRALFSHEHIIFTININTIYADVVFLEQVLINLIKNAIEAESNTINITIDHDHRASTPQTEIRIKDNGHGFSNTDNIFVPLYTTKPDGQGIGLTFCRNVIEQHNGSINLINHQKHLNTNENTTLNSQSGSGVSVIILLPNHSLAN